MAMTFLVAFKTSMVSVTEAPALMILSCAVTKSGVDNSMAAPVNKDTVRSCVNMSDIENFI
ncbi:hypothetical protein FM109_06280 [Vibrio casei]|nr:hypothetical protein FM109_06280 [Vibrio casei]